MKLRELFLPMAFDKLVRAASGAPKFGCLPGRTARWRAEARSNACGMTAGASSDLRFLQRETRAASCAIQGTARHWASKPASGTARFGTETFTGRIRNLLDAQRQKARERWMRQ